MVDVAEDALVRGRGTIEGDGSPGKKGRLSRRIGVNSWAAFRLRHSLGNLAVPPSSSRRWSRIWISRRCADLEGVVGPDGARLQHLLSVAGIAAGAGTPSVSWACTSQPGSGDEARQRSLPGRPTGPEAVGRTEDVAERLGKRPSGSPTRRGRRDAYVPSLEALRIVEAGGKREVDAALRAEGWMGPLALTL